VKNMPQMLSLSPRRVVTSCLLGLAFLGLSLILLGLLQANGDASLPAAAAPNGFARALQEHADLAPAGEPRASAAAGLLQGCGMPWYVNDDGVVDIDDIGGVAARWRTSEANPIPNTCQLV